jgi:hypothetical protein
MGCVCLLMRMMKIMTHMNNPGLEPYQFVRFLVLASCHSTGYTIVDSDMAPILTKPTVKGS